MKLSLSLYSTKVGSIMPISSSLTNVSAYQDRAVFNPPNLKIKRDIVVGITYIKIIYFTQPGVKLLSVAS